MAGVLSKLSFATAAEKQLKQRKHYPTTKLLTAQLFPQLIPPVSNYWYGYFLALCYNLKFSCFST